MRAVESPLKLDLPSNLFIALDIPDTCIPWFNVFNHTYLTHCVASCFISYIIRRSTSKE